MEPHTKNCMDETTEPHTENNVGPDSHDSLPDGRESCPAPLHQPRWSSTHQPRACTNNLHTPTCMHPHIHQPPCTTWHVGLHGSTTQYKSTHTIHTYQSPRTNLHAPSCMHAHIHQPPCTHTFTNLHGRAKYYDVKKECEECVGSLSLLLAIANTIRPNTPALPCSIKHIPMTPIWDHLFILFVNVNYQKWLAKK